MKKSQLKILLSKLEPLSDPKPEREQYQTPSEIASELLVQAEVAGDLGGPVIDLGTGNGILALGAAVLGTDKVYGYDVDEQAVETAEENRDLLEEELGRELSAVFRIRDVVNVETAADTVVMNPPFGLQRGTGQLNRVFLEKAFDLAPTVYALLHQSVNKRDETRHFIEEMAARQGFCTSILAWFKFPIPRAFTFHENEQEQINVDLYKFYKE